jgi:polyvinyl alcohol dehydrogenase (cytochrome)
MAPIAGAAGFLLWLAMACPTLIFAAVVPDIALCPKPADPVAVGAAQWNGWGGDIDNSRYQPEPAIRASDVSRLRFKWAYGYTGGAAGASAGGDANATANAMPNSTPNGAVTDAGQPTVVDGRLFVASAAGHVYALDAVTGCTYWSFDAAAGTHTALVVGELAAPKGIFGQKKVKSKKKDTHIEVQKPPSALFFGDDSGAVYALDAQNGRLLWKTQADEHPLARIAGSPTLYKNRLYVPVSATEVRVAADPKYACCTFRGSVVALDISTGHMLWKTFMSAEQPKPYKINEAGTQLYQPAGMAIGSAPTIDGERELLYVATGKAYSTVPQAAANAIVALNLDDGRIAWTKSLPPPNTGADFDSAPVLRNLSLTRKILVTAQKAAEAYGLDPSRAGEIVWRSKLEIAGAAGATQWGPAADHRSVYLAFAAAQASAAAQETASAQATDVAQEAAVPQATPATPAGGLVALDIATGQLRWDAASPEPPCTWGPRDCSHVQSQAVTVIPGVAFLGSMDGHLRGFSTIDGKIVWDVDTAKAYSTANGVQASGGSLDRGGPVVVGGMLYVNSGDLLLAFSLDGK